MEKVVSEVKLLSVSISIRKLSSKIKADKLDFVRYKEAI